MEKYTAFIHRWSCQHEEVVNAYGERIPLDENVDYAELIPKQPPYPCPACSDPMASQIDLLTKPIVPASMMPRQAPAPSAGINPMAATFVPSSMIVLSPEEMARTHSRNKYCPQSHVHCHWHRGNPCHEKPENCEIAMEFIKISYRMRGRWADAPVGWNAQHDQCIRSRYPVRCALHQKCEDELVKQRGR